MSNPVTVSENASKKGKETKTNSSVLKTTHGQISERFRQETKRFRSWIIIAPTEVNIGCQGSPEEGDLTQI